MDGLKTMRGGGKSLEDLTADATATAADILAGKTAYANGALITGTLEKGYKMVTGAVRPYSGSRIKDLVVSGLSTIVGILMYSTTNGTLTSSTYLYYYSALNSFDKTGIYAYLSGSYLAFKTDAPSFSISGNKVNVYNDTGLFYSSSNYNYIAFGY